MKKIILILVAVMLLGATNSFAQKYNEKLLSNEEFFEKADFIIEGRSVGDSWYTYDSKGNFDRHDLYTRTLFIVRYVYKNNSNRKISGGDTIAIIIKGGCFNGASYLNEDSSAYEIREMICFPSQADYESGKKTPLWISDETPSICFFTKHNLPEDSVIRNETKYLKVNLLQNIEEASIKMHNSRWSEVSGLNNLQFKNRYYLYKYMEQYDGIEIPILNRTEIKWTFGDSYDEYLKELGITEKEDKEYERKKREEWDSLMNIRLKKAKENRDSIKNTQGYLNTQKSNNNLSLSIQNQKIVYESNNKFYYYFDVYVNANNNLTYLDNN